MTRHALIKRLPHGADAARCGRSCWLPRLLALRSLRSWRLARRGLSGCYGAVSVALRRIPKRRSCPFWAGPLTQHTIPPTLPEGLLLPILRFSCGQRSTGRPQTTLTGTCLGLHPFCPVPSPVVYGSDGFAVVPALTHQGFPGASTPPQVNRSSRILEPSSQKGLGFWIHHPGAALRGSRQRSTAPSMGRSTAGSTQQPPWDGLKPLTSIPGPRGSMRRTGTALADQVTLKALAAQALLAA